MDGAGREELTSHKLLTAKTFKYQVVWWLLNKATVTAPPPPRVTSSVADWNYLKDIHVFFQPEPNFLLLQDWSSWSLNRSALGGWWVEVSGSCLPVSYVPTLHVSGFILKYCIRGLQFRGKVDNCGFWPTAVRQKPAECLQSLVTFVSLKKK